jgi:hypothetical protein
MSSSAAHRSSTGGPTTRRHKQLQAEALYCIPDAQIARVCSFLPLQSLVCGAAVASKTWRGVVASYATAWTTAVRQLDPCARLGPQALRRQQPSFSLPAKRLLPGGVVPLALLAAVVRAG